VCVCAHTRLLHSPGLRGSSWRERVVQRSMRAWVVEVERGKKRARARLKILVSSSREMGDEGARNEERIMIFKNFG